MNMMTIAKFECPLGHFHYAEDTGALSISPCFWKGCSAKMEKQETTYDVEFPDF